MQPFTTLTGIAAPIDEPNIDTNQLCPTRFNKVPRGPEVSRRAVSRPALQRRRLGEGALAERRAVQARADHRRGPQLGRRLVARERRLCAVPVRHTLRDRAELRRHSFEQLREERLADGDSARGRMRGDPPSSCASIRARPSAWTSRRKPSRTRRAKCIVSTFTPCARNACSKGWTTLRAPRSTTPSSARLKRLIKKSGRGCLILNPAVNQEPLNAAARLSPRPRRGRMRRRLYLPARSISRAASRPRCPAISRARGARTSRATRNGCAAGCGRRD